MNKNQQPRILIATCKAGMGHLRCAQALQKTFHTIAPELHVDLVDVMQESDTAFGCCYGRGYEWLVAHAPELWRLLYDSTNHPDPERKRPTSKFLATLNRMCTKQFTRRMQNNHYDIAISTHFLATELLLNCKKRGQFTGRIEQIVTDYDLHASWVFKGLQRCWLASNEIAETWASQVDDDDCEIRNAGIPIDPDFHRPNSKTSARHKFELQTDRPTILIINSGITNRNADMLEIVSHLAHNYPHTQCIAIAGHNKTLLQQLRTLHLPNPFILRPMGWTNAIPEAMAASDIYIGKAGGLISNEALASGLALLFTSAIPGQEESNATHIESQAAGLICWQSEQYKSALHNLLHHPTTLLDMQSKATNLSNPNAAAAIATSILNM